MKNKNKLIGFEDQFKNFVNLYINNKLPNKILLTGNKGIGKFLFSSHYVNFILSEDEKYSYNIKDFEIDKRNKSYILFENNINPNIFVIKKKNDKKNIEISQIREMIKFQNRSSFNNKSKFVIIDNISDLNLNSSNALLKSIEEPNNNVFFILTHNTGSQVQDTLRSRCIEFKMMLSSLNHRLVLNNYFSELTYENLSLDFVNYYSNPSFDISLINYLIENSLDYKSIKLEELIYFIIKKKDYVKNIFIKENINFIIDLFFYKHINLTNNISYKLKKYFNYKFNEINKYNLDMESYFIEFQEKLLSE